MSSKVAVVEFGKEGKEGKESVAESYREALRLIGGIDELNTPERSVVVKVGVFSHKAENHSSVEVVDAIINNFSKAPQIFLTESDNYRGTGTERLQIWRELFNERVVPFNLSEDTNTKRVTLAGLEMELSHLLFKPSILVDTHVFRTYERGSILKNLFGCTPDPKKAKFHKDTIFYSLLADIFEAVGGIDLAVMDGTYLWHDDLREPMNILLIGRDAVAVETVGAYLAGLKPEKMQTIQEFVKRGLGVGDLKEIEIVGTPLEELKQKCASAAKTLKKEREKRGGAPKIWSPAIDELIKGGFFNLPNKRTGKDVEKALTGKGIATKGKLSVINTTLNRKAKKGLLKGEKGPDGWIYWTE